MLMRSVDIESNGISGDRTLICTFDATSEDIKKIDEFARKHYSRASYYPDVRQIINDSLPLLFGGNVMPQPKKVIFNGPATIVLWEDGTKTVVKKSDDDEYDWHMAIIWCIMKKIFGSFNKANKYLEKIYFLGGKIQ